MITPPPGARALAVVLTVSAFGVPAAATAQTPENVNGGTAPGQIPVDPVTPGPSAKLNPDGTALAPAAAPEPVKKVIAAGNAIAKKPYRYGGGHGPKFVDTAYDCSGSMSYALKGARLLRSPLDSTGFMSWGQPGAGQWITSYANPGHAYLVVAGLRFDTSGAKATGSRWQSAPRRTSGYSVRHPVGF